MQRATPIAALALFAATLGQAQILPEAAAAFPATTFSAEYDSLTRLRALPNYASLRKQYSGEGLQRAQKDLLSIGISESQLSEVVTAAGQNGFFGMLAGNFHIADVTQQAASHGIEPGELEDGPVFCAKEGTCVLLLSKEDGRAFFGNMEQLRAISDVRQGRAAALQSNQTFAELTAGADPKAPVIGFAPGREIGEWIGGSIPQAISSRFDLTRLFSSIQNFSYVVKLDSKAHVGLNLQCSSEQASTIVADTLSAAGGLQRAAAAAAGPNALPFNRLTAQASGHLVAVSLEAAVQ